MAITYYSHGNSTFRSSSDYTIFQNNFPSMDLAPNNWGRTANGSDYLDIKSQYKIINGKLYFRLYLINQDSDSTFGHIGSTNGQTVFTITNNTNNTTQSQTYTMKFVRNGATDQIYQDDSNYNHWLNYSIHYFIDDNPGSNYTISIKPRWEAAHTYTITSDELNGNLLKTQLWCNKTDGTYHADVELTYTETSDTLPSLNYSITHNSTTATNRIFISAGFIFYDTDISNLGPYDMVNYDSQIFNFDLNTNTYNMSTYGVKTIDYYNQSITSTLTMPEYNTIYDQNINTIINPPYTKGKFLVMVQFLPTSGYTVDTELYSKDFSVPTAGIDLSGGRYTAQNAIIPAALNNETTNPGDFKGLYDRLVLLKSYDNSLATVPTLPTPPATVGNSITENNYGNIVLYIYNLLKNNSNYTIPSNASEYTNAQNILNWCDPTKSTYSYPEIPYLGDYFKVLEYWGNNSAGGGYNSDYSGLYPVDNGLYAGAHLFSFNVDMVENANGTTTWTLTVSPKTHAAAGGRQLPDGDNSSQYGMYIGVVDSETEKSNIVRYIQSRGIGTTTYQYEGYYNSEVLDRVENGQTVTPLQGTTTLTLSGSAKNYRIAVYLIFSLDDNIVGSQIIQFEA